MNYPFIKKFKDKIFIRLNKELYKKELIEKIEKEEPDSVVYLKSQKNYYLLELRVDNFSEYLNFLNYLIYLNRIR